MQINKYSNNINLEKLFLHFMKKAMGKNIIHQYGSELTTAIHIIFDFQA